MNVFENRLTHALNKPDPQAEKRRFIAWANAAIKQVIQDTNGEASAAHLYAGSAGHSVFGEREWDGDEVIEFLTDLSDQFEIEQDGHESFYISHI